MWHTQKMQEQTGLNCANEQRENWEQRKTCSKSSVVVALCLLPTENWNEKNCWFLNEIASEKCCESCSRWSVHCKNLKQKSLTKGGERATSAEDCWRVSVGVSVQQYSVQCKGYNLIGVTTVEASETRGTTALVYCLISSSLYTGTVQGWWSTPQLVWRSAGV